MSYFCHIQRSSDKTLKSEMIILSLKIKIWYTTLNVSKQQNKSKIYQFFFDYYPIARLLNYPLKKTYRLY